MHSSQSQPSTDNVQFSRLNEPSDTLVYHGIIIEPPGEYAYIVEITDKTIPALLKDLDTYLNEHPEVTTLKLKGNHIGDEGASAICDFLEKHPQIKHLDLSDNKICDGMFKFIDNTTLETFDLSNNPGFSDRMGFSQWFIPLTKLFLSDEKIEGLCAGFAQSLIPFLLEAFPLRNVILINELFRELYKTLLRENAIEDEENLKKWFEKLSDIDRHYFKQAFEQLLTTIAKLHKTQNLKWLFFEEFAKNVACYDLPKTDFTKAEFAERLTLIREKAKATNTPFCLYLCARDHAVLLSYVPKTNEWIIGDANRLPLRVKKTDKGAAGLIFECFNVIPKPAPKPGYLSFEGLGYLRSSDQSKKDIIAKWKPGFEPKPSKELLMKFTVALPIIAIVFLTIYLPVVILSHGLATLPLLMLFGTVLGGSTVSGTAIAGLLLDGIRSKLSNRAANEKPATTKQVALQTSTKQLNKALTKQSDTSAKSTEEPLVVSETLATKDVSQFQATTKAEFGLFTPKNDDKFPMPSEGAFSKQPMIGCA